MFNSFYKRIYLQELAQNNELRKELSEFQADVYEKETIKVLNEEIRQLKSSKEVLEGKISVLYDCNSTLSQVLRK